MNKKEILIAPMVSAITPQGVIGMPLACGALYILIMKTINLSQGQVALVDDWNYEWLNQWKWYARKDKNGNYYAQRNPGPRGAKVILMHRLIMQTPNDKEVDHQDHNGLNCLESNMRNCTHKQNCANISGRKDAISTFIGVTYDKNRINKKWRAQIRLGNKNLRIGNYETETEAAIAHDDIAKLNHGEFANLNFPKL
jgi:hypothetical protein